MLGKLCGLTVLLVLLGAWAALAQTIYGSAYPAPGGVATLYTISPTTGAATPIGSIGFPQVGSLAFAANGTLYGVGFLGGTSVLLTINTTTGAGSLVGSTGIADFFQDIAFRSDGTLFGYAGHIPATGPSVGNIYTINTTTGAATLVGSTGKGFPFGDGLAFAAANVLYTANQLELDSIDQFTGTATTVIPLNYAPDFGTEIPRANGMKFDPFTGTLYAAVVSGGNQQARVRSLGTINISTGVVTRIGPTIDGLDAIAIASQTTPPPVPALSSFGQVLFVVLLFLGGLLFLRRRLSPAA